MGNWHLQSGWRKKASAAWLFFFFVFWWAKILEEENLDVESQDIWHNIAELYYTCLYLSVCTLHLHYQIRKSLRLYGCVKLAARCLIEACELDQSGPQKKCHGDWIHHVSFPGDSILWLWWDDKTRRQKDRHRMGNQGDKLAICRPSVRVHEHLLFQFTWTWHKGLPFAEWTQLRLWSLHSGGLGWDLTVDFKSLDLEVFKQITTEHVVKYNRKHH